MNSRPENTVATTFQCGTSSEISRKGFSEEDIQSFYRLYRDGRITFARAEPQHLTRFTAIEDFIVETRRTGGVIPEIGTIDIVAQQNESTQLMRTWLTQIVPSCVYRHRSNTFGQTGFYICCFSNCARPVSSQFALIRHYREQHFSQMPPGIFGQIVFYNCDICGLQFKRETHLNTHLNSLAHIAKMAQNGILFLLLLC